MMIDPGDFTPEALAKIAPACHECGGPSEIAQAEAIYPNRPDLWQRQDGTKPWYWLCSKCWAYAGVHPRTLQPLGSPAGPDTRAARSAAHAAFDPLWRRRMRISNLTQNVARGRGYKWLAAQLGIDRKDCHIGMMDAATARRVVQICKAVGKAA
ncbi:MAG: hypothetical protein CMN63_08570 [Sphingobium sp.]|mgnify:FL=1|nr:hypothetical protein [Sphingobium sp.]